jgi:PAS domain S-box-containing protein
VVEGERHPRQLHRRDEPFRTLMQNASDIVAVLDADGTIRYISPAVERVLGYRPEELVGTKAFDHVHPDDLEEALGIFAENLSEPGVHPPLEFRVVHKDGSWRYIEHVANNLLDDSAVKGMVVNQRDITGRKQAGEQLRESERRFATVLSNARAYIYRCLNEPGWPNEFASDYALELTGYPPEELLVGGKVRFGDLIVEEDRERVWEEVQAALARRERFELRYTIRRRDGTLRHVEEYGQGVFDGEGGVVALEGLVYDVTELKQAEDRLREAQTRYRTLVEQIPAITYIQEAGGSKRITYITGLTR